MILYIVRGVFKLGYFLHFKYIHQALNTKPKFKYTVKLLMVSAFALFGSTEEKRICDGWTLWTRKYWSPDFCQGLVISPVSGYFYNYHCPG